LAIVGNVFVAAEAGSLYLSLDGSRTAGRLPGTVAEALSPQ
jgi:hypothetical protein